MPTGDGLLVRVHPPLGRLTSAQARAVAAGARRFGNGHVDVTARANLQIRGVTEATRCGLSEALAAVGLGDVRHDGGPQRLTLTTPLAGLESGAPIDVPALAQRIEAIGLAIPGLPPKALVAVEADAHGITLGTAEADLHCVVTGRDLALHLAGNAAWWHLPAADAQTVVEAAMRLLAASGARRMRDVSAEVRADALARFGLHRVPAPAVRGIPQPGLFVLENSSPPTPVRSERGSPLLEGRAIAVTGLLVENPHAAPRHPGAAQRSPGSRNAGGARFYTVSGYGFRARLQRPGMMEWYHPQSPLLEGKIPKGEGQGEVRGSSGELTHLTPTLSFQERERRRASSSQAEGPVALLVDAPFGRCTADALDSLADTADAAGANDLRLSPTRGFLLVCRNAGTAEIARKTLAEAGFLTRADDPRGAVAACPGAPACASGSTPTLRDAARLAEAFRPFAARGLRAHVSGCPKGCAHPGAADLTLVGRDGQYDVVLSGRPDALPATRLPFEAALERVRRADPASSLAQIVPEHPPGPRPS
jgi:sulfite reductase beta subunit-like hemoprotein